MALVVLKDITISFGGDPVLDGVAFQLEAGQRVCLLGRNGEGKTTLMQIISGELEPDAGSIRRLPDLCITRLPQDVPDDLDGRVFDVVAEGLGHLGQAISDYHRAGVEAVCGAPAALKALGDAQHRLEVLGAWDLNNQVENVLTQMQLSPEADVSSLSGGMKRRVLLARSLVAKPDILLLDEPTNHLDVHSICWLETFLSRFKGTVFFVTHDRSFMRRLATRILELDRGRVFDWACDYPTFLKRKAQLLEDERISNARADRLLSQEESWIRQGIKARRTRNEGRVRRLMQMREQRRSRRAQSASARVSLQQAERSGNLVIRAMEACFTYGDADLIHGLTTTIERGDRVGIIGPNGCGKTTLIKLLLGRLEPTAGRVKVGTKVKTVYFDQLRQALDPLATVFDTVNEGKDKVLINGHWRSVFSYLQDFLFTPERARSPVVQLSGGEKNRLMLAKLLTRPANLLVMDEPTNDLDVETLELLEERLLEFEGTILLVSHDREFINNVATSTLVFEGGEIREYAGGYEDWVNQSAGRRQEAVAGKPSTDRRCKRAEAPGIGKPRRLTYKEAKELEGLPARIDDAENRQQELYAKLADPNFYKGAGGTVASVKAELAQTEALVERLYERWEDLEAIPK